MSNNQIEQIKQFLHNEICERRDYSASKMCEETLKFIEQMNNNKIDYQAGLQWDEYGNPSPILDGGEMTMNNNPGNNMTTNNPLNMTALRTYITMYLDDIDAYGEEDELTEATNVLHDFVTYLKSMRGLTEGETDDEQAMIDYNAMEEEWEMDNYNEMQQ